MQESGQISETEIEQTRSFFFGELKQGLGIRVGVGMAVISMGTIKSRRPKVEIECLY